MRVNCLNEDLSKNITNINTLEEQQQYRFCLIINQILTEGEPPNFWKQFLEDFYFTFKNHWGRNVNDKIIEKINSLNLCCWTNILIKWIKIIYSVVWQLILQPLFTFFADYFVHIWELYVLPIIQSFI
uniref:Uncharacterized protein n=1 Tax=Meloidogyne hapla TaxID=6305 RepID=A0A1I8B1T1_MELHA